MVSKKRKKTAAIAAVTLVCHLLGSFVITKLIYDFIFRRYDPADSAITDSALTEIMHPVSFLSGDNRLAGMLFNGPGDSLVVIVQGVHSNTGKFAPIIRHIVEQNGRDVFLYDGTGCGQSQGQNGVGFCQGIYDLHAALDYINLAYDYEDIFLVGHSRGGYAACCVLPERTDIDGVVTINSPNSAMDAVMSGSVNTVGWLAYGNYPMLYLYQAMLFDFETVSQTASDAIAQSDVPVLIIQSRQDETVIWNRFSIYACKDELTGSNTEFLLTDGDHSSLMYEPNEELWNQIHKFFAEHGNGALS